MPVPGHIPQLMHTLTHRLHMLAWSQTCLVTIDLPGVTGLLAEPGYCYQTYSALLFLDTVGECFHSDDTAPVPALSQLAFPHLPLAAPQRIWARSGILPHLLSFLHAKMSHSCALRRFFLKINQLSRAPLQFRLVFHSILLSRSPNKTNICSSVVQGSNSTTHLCSLLSGL